MSCEDYPCCGHEPGDCPTYDSKGRAVYRCAICRRQLKPGATSSICQPCITHRTKMVDRNDYDPWDRD